jgi:DNA invertase Pin-like site-specific DNA recombinase
VSCHGDPDIVAVGKMRPEPGLEGCLEQMRIHPEFGSHLGGDAGWQGEEGVTLLLGEAVDEHQRAGLVDELATALLEGERGRMSRATGTMPASVKKLRAAVYTRVSTDERLDQAYNSLDAQRDACEAYVASQRAEGWVLVGDRYDDGGFSGGSLERPALKRLLADIEQGLIDVIVVYKIDRLSRSLMDFAKLVETMEAHRVTFVSVTQSFNTTTSMGRLTLNILLSFAQFEREVIGERIRDKFAASRARGMWMGGKVPLGYDVANRKLVVNKAEAVRVRRVFELFIETGSGVETMRRLQTEGVTAKSGRPLDKGDVYKVLNLRTYIGEVTHKGNVYRGEHEAVVPRGLWDEAHAILGVSPRSRAAQNRQHAPALLKGLIFGVDGRALSPTHARKNGRLYRYYVAQRVLKGDEMDGIVRRVSAAQIEGAVVDQVRALLRQPEIVAGTWMAVPDMTEREVHDALNRLEPLWGELFPAEQARIVRALVDRVVVGPDGVDIRLRVEGLAGLAQQLTSPPEALRAAA